MSLKRALLILVVLVLAVGIIPAGIVAHGRLARALREQTRESLAMAPDLLDTRWSATVDVRMMHARDVARTPGLAEALMAGDQSRAARIVEEAGSAFPESPLLFGPDGSPVIAGDGNVPEALLAATRRGEMPVEAVQGDSGVQILSLAPVEMDGAWMGAAGGISQLDETEAAALAGLTRAQVLILDGDGRVVAASVSDSAGHALAESLSQASLAAGTTADPTSAGSSPPDPNPAAHEIHEIRVGETPYLALSVPLSAASTVVFLKNLDQELAVLPLLRGIAFWSGGITLALALLLGTLFAARLARPVGSLANAADRLAAGDFDAPLGASGINEVSRVSDAFDQMRTSLRARLADLQEANRELEDRQERLTVLQGELIQRERLASTGRLLAQLAHEIRNPIASIRNCLEVVRRRAEEDPEAQRFADLAIDELLRMHELTEQMLDVHRPRDTEGSVCNVAQVAREVASLVRAGAPANGNLTVSVVGPDQARARIAPDSLKQVLLNLGLNAREAMHDEGPMEIVIDVVENQVTVEVLDRGPGIPEGIRPRVFDPFFTTKSEVQGVGLGLFTAEAVVRTFGGQIQTANRTDGPGARFTVRLPAADDGEDDD